VRASDFRSRDTTESIDEERDYRRDLANETEDYNTLVREGGRPSHPVSLGRDILDDPGKYREILSYWQLHNHDAEGRVWKVFRSQMCEWQAFREWQRKNRAQGRFPKYAEGVKGGLAEHGFTRPFQLDEDPERQDKLTTWIEFLDYEYWWYDKDIRVVKRHQPRYDEAWKKLLDSQVLRPSETEKFICNIKSSIQHASEEDRAERAVQSAKLAVISAQKATTDPQHCSLSERELRRRLAAVESRLDAAVKSLESIKRRIDLTSELHKKTRNYQIARDNAERRSILLRWMLQQVPLIEPELNQAKLAEYDANGRNDDQRGSKRNRADVSIEERVSKRQRQDGESEPISDCRTRISTAEKRKSCHDPLSEGQASKRLKRDGQSYLSPHKTSDAADPTPIGETISVQPPITQDSGAIAARSVKTPSLRLSTPRRRRSEATTPAKRVLDGKARVLKKRGGSGKSSNFSNLGSSPRRRSTRMRKPPDRFQ
jgi:hypothetical protein